MAKEAFLLLFVFLCAAAAARTGPTRVRDSSLSFETRGDFFSQGAAFLEVDEEEEQQQNTNNIFSSWRTAAANDEDEVENYNNNNIKGDHYDNNNSNEADLLLLQEEEDGVFVDAASSSATATITPLLLAATTTTRGPKKVVVEVTPEEVEARHAAVKLQVAVARMAGANEAVRQAARNRLAEVVALSSSSSPSSSSSSPVEEEAVEEAEEEEETHSTAERCQNMQSAQLALAEVQKRANEAKALLESARVHLRSSKVSAKDALAEQTTSKTVLDEQSALVDILLARLTQIQMQKQQRGNSGDLVVLEEELFARLHRQAMVSTAVGKRFGTVLSLLQHAADTEGVRSQLVQLRSRVEMEQERAATQAQRAASDVVSATAVVSERQEQYDKVAVEEALAEQNMAVARINAAGLDCFVQ